MSGVLSFQGFVISLYSESLPNHAVCPLKDENLGLKLRQAGDETAPITAVCVLLLSPCTQLNLPLFLLFQPFH